MKLQERKSLNQLYNREEEFSADLADHLDALKVGQFEDAETEANVGARKADIVATGEDGTLVIENQFGKANWDHWGRLEAYARLKEADVAVLVAEEFEELMIDTCRLRDDVDSSIDWYLIEAHANSHDELSFHHVVGPSKDIKTEKTAGDEESEFWAPIRRGEYGPLFAGKPVPRKYEHWISKSIRSIGVHLYITSTRCYILLYFGGILTQEENITRRDAVVGLFSDQDYNFELNDPSAKQVTAKLPVLEKGKNDREDWDEIREALVQKGKELYNAIENSGA
ncbi:MAG: hypothetical protein OXT69_06045 [Candidatus Poribacteria bacterium]|nr:hypothetical protein [Candidatus Poribacteria bacterium]